MPLFTLQFETKIRGNITVEAATKEEALAWGDKQALGTLNYDELTDQGQKAPDVETECVDVYTPNIAKKAIKINEN